MPKLIRNKWTYIVLAAIAGGWWYMHGSPASDSGGQAAVRVTIAPVTRQDVPKQVKLVGNVIATESVAIKSRLDSQITGVFFHDGDSVQEGQKLFELDDRAVKAQVAQLQADVVKERAQLVNMRLQYERAEKLLASKVAAQAEVDNARAAYEAQMAQVNAAQANLDSTRVLLTYTTINAPISGKAGTINVTRGNTVKANDTGALVTINQVSPIHVQFAIPQRYYEEVRAAMTGSDGLPVQALRNESPEPAQGKLESLDNSIDIANGTFLARASFPNEDEKLWPGMFVNVVLNLGTQKAVLTIPTEAVQGDENNRFVFTVDPATSKAARKAIKIGDVADAITVVTDGLNESEKVVTDGLLRVTEGAKVEIAAPAKIDGTKKPDELP